MKTARDMTSMAKLLTNPRGFTLSEVLMSVFIFTILGAACYTIMASSSSSWQVNRVRVELQQELRKSQNWIIHELRQSGSSVLTNVPADGSANHSSATFRTGAGVSGGSITWSASTIQFLLNGTQLQRISGATTKVLAQNITVLQFRREAATPNLVEVTLVAQKTVPGSSAISGISNFKVQMRN